jgi:SAM-dependent methyltransferase
MSKNAQCPLCTHTTISPYHHDKQRVYLRCHRCDLVFVSADQHLNTMEEKAYYDLHDNRCDDPAYRRFLDRLFQPLNQRLRPHSHGLDFGCGPGPALAKMFEEAGHTINLFDSFYAPDKAVLSKPYDFITLSEVVEHLSAPGRELDKLWACLAEGGWLAIMTKRVRNPEAFKTWHYITDPTHVSYFSETTFHWLTAHWHSTTISATLTIAGSDVVLIQKGKKSASTR